MRTLRTVVFVAGAMLADSEPARASTLYLTQFSGTAGALVDVQTGSILDTFTTTSATQTGVAVSDTNPCNQCLPRQRARHRVPTFFGNVLNAGIYSNSTINSLYDGTTDGVYNYAIGHNDFTSGFGLFRFDLDWSNPVQIFTPTRRSSGITFDQQTGTLWTTATVGTASHVQNYSLGGTLLSEFLVSVPGGYSIAWDPADGTLWIPEFGTQQLRQYDRNGSLLQVLAIPGLHSLPMGAEFQLTAVPEPSSLLLLASGFGIWSGGRRFRRQR